MNGKSITSSRNKRKAGFKTGFGQPVAQSVNLGKGQSQKSKNTGRPAKKDRGNAETVNVSLNLLTSFVFLTHWAKKQKIG